MGRSKDGGLKSFTPGMELYARYTFIAEGARGSLAKSLIKTFELDKNCDPQHYGLGIKEIWEVDPSVHSAGHVVHHLGWPLPNDTGGVASCAMPPTTRVSRLHRAPRLRQSLSIAV